jgi:hypothetical protein
MKPDLHRDNNKCIQHDKDYNREDCHRTNRVEQWCSCRGRAQKRQQNRRVSVNSGPILVIQILGNAGTVVAEIRNVMERSGVP